MVLFVGDVASLVGSIWAKLVPTVIVIAVYICIADTVLVCQCLYYNARNARRSRRLSDELPTPTTPLLGRQISDDLGLPESRRRRSSASLRSHHPRLAENALADFVGESGSGRSAWVNNLLSVLAICVIGSAGWAMAWRTGVWTPTPAGSGGGTTRTVGSQVLGYISAICYLRFVEFTFLRFPLLLDWEFTNMNAVAGSHRSTKTILKSLAKVEPSFPRAVNFS